VAPHVTIEALSKALPQLKAGLESGDIWCSRAMLVVLRTSRRRQIGGLMLRSTTRS
jgi:hypothetical protein